LDNQRNIILAVVLCIALVFGFDLAMGWLYPQANQPQQVTAAKPDADTPTERAAVRHTREGGLNDPTEVAEEARDLRGSLAAAGRIRIDAPEVAGSINPVGARVDDIVLKTHRQAVEKDSGPVRLFSPAGTPAQQFAQFGWVGEGVKLPTAQTVWHAEGGPLAPNRPVTLTWDNGEGQRFTQRFTIDGYYMLTVAQTVANTGDGTIAVRPYAFINRTSRTASQDTWNLHSGPIGEFGDGVDFEWDYDDVDDENVARPEGRPHWIGFTDIYWLSTLIPQDGARTTGEFRALGNENYRADLLYDPVTIASGEQVTRTTRLFAGAKESDVLNRYEDAGVAKFGLAIDWGWFRWFMYPIFWLLKQYYALTGNFGVAIMLLTVTVRILMFPVAQRQFASMAQMRAVQPKMKALQERYKDDKVQLQQAMGALQEGRRQPARGLPADLPADPDLLRALQGPDPGDRDASPALRAVDQGPFGARSAAHPQPVRPAAFYAALVPRHRRACAAAGRDDVLPVPAEPGAGGPGAAADVRDHALGHDVRHGALCRGPADLLDHFELPDDGAADVPLREAPAAQGAEGQGLGRCPARRGAGQKVSEQEALQEEARRLFSGRVEFLLSARRSISSPKRTFPRSRSRGARTSARAR
jgi:YidC/Oxa1 family membrane protein insertase